MNILSIKNIRRDFSGLKALDDVSINVEKGEIVGLIGPNGSGKTTLINIISGFLPPTSGSVTYKGQVISGLQPHKLAGLGIARTFQLASVFPELTVEENILIGSHLKNSSGILGSIFQTRSYRREKIELSKKVDRLIDFLGLEKQRRTPARFVPFGDQRKLEIAITLAAEPEVLLVDEPAAGMNPSEQVKLVALLRSINSLGITLIMVEHKMRVVMDVCQKIAVLNFGTKIAEGTPREIAQDENVITAYLGKSGREENAEYK